MCGIVAMISGGRPIDAGALTAATAALRHRGPDGIQTWVAPDGRTGLGHTRLSIASAEGDQPIASEDGRRWIVMNGEFYDFIAIRRRLEAGGHRFATRIDSEIALHLYEDLGPACLEHLRGEFAFILWDGVTGTLFAARDRFGIKPLFYARQGDSLVLASEAKALFAAGVPARWDQESVYQHLFGCFHADRSLFSGIRQIEPGHYLQSSGPADRLVRYWDINYPRQRDHVDIDDAAAIEEVRRLLREAIQLRMQAHVPVGYLLSGGLDSSGVLSMAAAQDPSPLRAFTIGFEGNRYDESAKAQVAAGHVRADLDIVRVNETDLADNFAAAVRSGEMFQVNAHGTARFLLSRAIQAAGYRAVMAGEGADELFAGYGFIRPMLGDGGDRAGPVRRLLRLRRLPGLLSEDERRIARIAPRFARASRAFDLPQPLLARFGAAVEMVAPLLSPDFAHAFAGHDPYLSFLRRFDWRGQLLGREPAKQVLYLWLRSIFVNYHLAADRLDMAHAVEVRLPFLDHRLFEYASQLPTDLLSRHGQNKHVLREAARPFIAESVYSGAKQPFYAPPTMLQPQSRMFQLASEMVRGETMKSLPFFQQQALVDLLDRGPSLDGRMQAMLDPLVMLAVSICFLQEQFGLS